MNILILSYDQDVVAQTKRVLAQIGYTGVALKDVDTDYKIAKIENRRTLKLVAESACDHFKMATIVDMSEYIFDACPGWKKDLTGDEQQLATVEINVLKKLEGKDNRATQTYLCAIAKPSSECLSFKGRMSGTIANAARGNGIGMLRLFKPAGARISYSNLDDARKDKYGVRYQSIIANKDKILNYLK